MGCLLDGQGIRLASCLPIGPTANTPHPAGPSWDMLGRPPGGPYIGPMPSSQWSWPLAVAVILIVLEAVLIVLLLFQRAGRTSANARARTRDDREMQRLRQELAHIGRVSAM